MTPRVRSRRLPPRVRSRRLPPRVRSRRLQQLRCAVCHDDRDVPPHTCSVCGTRTPADCLRDAGRCPTLGCDGCYRPLPEAPNNVASVLLGVAFLALFMASGLILRAGMRSAHTLLPRPASWVGDDAGVERHDTLAPAQAQ